ncbi:MAG: flagellar motor protein MotA [Devosia sp.]|uniref:flagellar motor protein MotA n=1 Tax=unclassified Devosia TaxID=196773 RepID=UPI0019ED2084|nr:MULTISPECIES: flagellar motor protein MotA [unclassified Devosia]MBF0678777.1 flagellar motor protein MotA [Devosia sp.]WEJ32854.1 flagellar motor protein MotA [Devosia sp. SD17-2]
MSQGYDPYHLASPTVYLVKIVIFLVLVALVGAILFTQITSFFWANPFINSMIFFALFVGIFLSFRQIFRLFPEVKWVNSLQDGTTTNVRPPILLAPVAGLLRERIGEAIITPSSMRSILDSVGNRLDEAKDTSRYLTGLLVFLGLMGTFYGLLETVTSVAGVINALDVTSSDSGALFANLKEGLAAPLGGMGTAFSSSLFGLAGSLVLGFLDLQTSQAQNAFYTDLEDWMTSMTELDHPVSAMQANAGGPDMQAMIDSIGATMQSQNSSQNAIRAMAELARGIDGLVKHIRTEQDDLRRYINEQGETNKKLRDLIKAMLNEADQTERRD